MKFSDVTKIMIKNHNKDIEFNMDFEHIKTNDNYIHNLFLELVSCNNNEEKKQIKTRIFNSTYYIIEEININYSFSENSYEEITQELAIALWESIDAYDPYLGNNVKRFFTKTLYNKYQEVTNNYVSRGFSELEESMKVYLAAKWAKNKLIKKNSKNNKKYVPSFSEIHKNLKFNRNVKYDEMIFALAVHANFKKLYYWDGTSSKDRDLGNYSLTLGDKYGVCDKYFFDNQPLFSNFSINFVKRKDINKIILVKKNNDKR